MMDNYHSGMKLLKLPPRKYRHIPFSLSPSLSTSDPQDNRWNSFYTPPKCTLPSSYEYCLRSSRQFAFLFCISTLLLKCWFLEFNNDELRISWKISTLDGLFRILYHHTIQWKASIMARMVLPSSLMSLLESQSCLEFSNTSISSLQCYTGVTAGLPTEGRGKVCKTGLSLTSYSAVHVDSMSACALIVSDSEYRSWSATVGTDIYRTSKPLAECRL